MNQGCASLNPNMNRQNHADCLHKTIIVTTLLKCFWKMWHQKSKGILRLKLWILVYTYLPISHQLFRLVQIGQVKGGFKIGCARPPCWIRTSWLWSSGQSKERRICTFLGASKIDRCWKRQVPKVCCQRFYSKTSAFSQLNTCKNREAKNPKHFPLKTW